MALWAPMGARKTTASRPPNLGAEGLFRRHHLRLQPRLVGAAGLLRREVPSSAALSNSGWSAC